MIANQDNDQISILSGARICFEKIMRSIESKTGISVGGHDINNLAMWMTPS